MPAWQFTDAVAPARAARLLSWYSFDQIAARIVAEAKVTGFEWDPFNHSRLKGCHRASFTIRVSSDAYDAFFNSPVGYRAQFAESVMAGEAANRQLLDALEGILVAALPVSPDYSAAKVGKSLRARDAKVWIDESGFEDEACDGPAILYEPWERNDPGGAGLHTPIGTILQIKGGWLDTAEFEMRDPWKAERSYSIHMKGDT